MDTKFQTYQKVDMIQLFDLIFNKSPHYFFVIDEQNNIVKANESLCKRSKLNDEEILGKNFKDIFRCEEKELNNKPGKSPLIKAIKNCKLFDTDDENTWYEVTIAPWVENNQTKLNAYHIRDITASKKLETKLAEQNERLWLLHDIDKAMHSALEFNYLLKIIMNGIIKLGYKSVSLYLVIEGEVVEGVISTKFSQKDMHNIKINMKNNKSIVNSTIKEKKPIFIKDIDSKDNVHYVNEELKNIVQGKSVLSMPLIIENKVNGIILLDNLDEIQLKEKDLQILELFTSKAATTINRAELYSTQQKFNTELRNRIDQATTELKAKNIKLEEIDKTKSALLSLVSHELKTPLTGIKGYASLFRRAKFGDINEQQKDALNIIINEADKLDGVVSEVLDLSKLVSGKEGLKLEVINFADIIKTAIKEMEVLADEKNIKVSFESQSIEKVVVDPDKIKSVMKNLLSNAIKFNKFEGKVNIRLINNPHFVQVSVQDTGIGIPPDQIQKIFEHFYQLEDHMIRTRGGAGVGLSIVKEIINLHQGDVWVKSVPGQDTQFSFRIPKDIKLPQIGQEENELLEALKELEAIRTIFGIIHGDMKLQDTLQLILESIKETVGFDRIRLYLLDHRKRILKGSVCINGPPDFEDIEIDVTKDKFMQDIFKKRKAIIYYRYKNTPINIRLGMKDDTPFTAMPIVVRDKVIGLITGDNSLSERIITGRDRKTFTTFVNSAAATITNATIMQQAEDIVQERTKELRRTNEKLKLIDRRKDDFLNYVSHEMRTPLTSVIGYSKLLLTKRLSQTQTGNAISIIYKESERLKRMIDDLLDLNILEEGVEMKLIPSNIYQVVGEVINIMRPNFEEKKLNVDVKGDNIPGLIEFDKEKIKQVLMNLISNAIKFTPEGDINISIKDQDEDIEVKIQDTGVGIAKEDINKLFNKFKQIDNKLNTDKGSGLGLVIAKSIIEAHRGKIWINSELGKGTSFHFTLPK
jgi:PAS domain S-box-containing protein